MTAGPGANEYSYTITGQTAGTYAGVQVTDGTWNNKWPSDNHAVILYDPTGSATIHFYPGAPGDGWLPLANRVGYDDPGNFTSWGIAGDLDGWDGTQDLLPSIGNGVYSNSVVVATAQTFGFKFQSPAGNWSDIYFGSDFGNGQNNGSYTTTASPQTIPVVLDLPNGRYLIGALAPKPVTNSITFSVDMSAQIAAGNFNPGADKVFVSGSLNGWPGTGAGALVLTNYPPYNGGSNTNIYYGTNITIDLPGTTENYKFTCNDAAYSGNNGYEPVSNNRTFNLLNVNGSEVLPTVTFGNVNLSDYLNTPVNVTFTVNMTNATTYPANNTHAFNPNTDIVCINGAFESGGWSAWNPISLSQMTEVGDSEVYTYTASVPMNSLIKVDYKYGIIYSGTTNYDDEAAAYNDHFRYIRITGTGNYTMPMDTFGNQYSEPSFGQLASATVGPGNVSVSWLGRPGVQLQVNNSLNAGTWQSAVETDGTNWITGSYSSTNGFVSQTNYPASSQQFFRLIQAW